MTRGLDLPGWINTTRMVDRNPYLKLISRLQELKKVSDENLDSYFLSKKLGSKELSIIQNLSETSNLTEINLLISAIKSGCKIQEITKHLDWNNFEKLIEEIFSQAGWNIKTNFRFFVEGGQIV